MGSADPNAHNLFPIWSSFLFSFGTSLLEWPFNCPLLSRTFPAQHPRMTANVSRGHWKDQQKHGTCTSSQVLHIINGAWATVLGRLIHPGPYKHLVIGSTNPGGLRSKEALAVAQGPGIWTYSETQLSAFTQVSSGKALRHAARQTNRLLRTHFGAPAPLRSRSDWAGTWTGVACTSDFSSKHLQIDWPVDLWNSGRVLATQHQIGCHNITVVSLYGLPRGPTWPQAAALMNDILAFITKIFVFGHSGLVAICGDFNFSPFELEHFHLWRAAGWLSAQELAMQRWAHEWAPTCKGATERDLIWLSPAALSICDGIHIEDVFSDHSSHFSHAGHR